MRVYDDQPDQSKFYCIRLTVYGLKCHGKKSLPSLSLTFFGYMKWGLCLIEYKKKMYQNIGQFRAISTPSEPLHSKYNDLRFFPMPWKHRKQWKPLTNIYLSTNTLNPYMELNERFLFNVLIHIFHATIFPLISPFALRVQRPIREPLFTVVFWAL